MLLYAVPAYDSEHYAHHIYGDPGYSKWGIRDRHIAIYGPLEKFGYHNFIPMFKAETYKKNDLPPGVGMLDHESSHPKEIIAQPWLCDYTIGTGLSPSWGYKEAMEIRSSVDVLRMLIEVVANNGQLLLNLSPKADGTIPENQKQVVLKVGQWLWAYGEAIYNTRPFSVSGEDIGNGQHVFYTRNGRNLYAIFLQYPGKEKLLRLRTLTPERLKAQVSSVKLLGIKTIDPCTFIASSGGLEFTLPKTSGQPSDLATVVRIELMDK